MTRTERLTAHTDVATSLALLSDHELADLVAEGTPVGDVYKRQGSAGARH